MGQWRIQRGFRWFARTPLPDPIFKYPMKMKKLGLSQTKLFHFHWIFNNEIKSAKWTPPHLYTNEPHFQKSWICLCGSGYNHLIMLYFYHCPHQSVCVFVRFAMSLTTGPNPIIFIEWLVWKAQKQWGFAMACPRQCITSWRLFLPTNSAM